jgi:MYXO-CTERM domain-containing protein
MRLLVCVAMGVGVIAPGSAWGADLATGLVGYWRLDEATTAGTAADSSPTGASGTFVNAPTPSTDLPPVAYVDARSLLLSRASTQAVRVAPVPAALEPAAVTLAAWFRVRTQVSNSGSGQGYADIVSVGDQTVLRVLRDQVATSKRIPGGTWTSLMASAAPGTNVWHHLAATMDATAVTLYFDGRSVGTAASAQPITYDLGADLWIGRHGSGTGRDFDGNVDEVAIWARVLSADDVAALAGGAQPGSRTTPPPPDAGAGGSGGTGGGAGTGGGGAGTGGGGAGTGGGGAGTGGGGGASTGGAGGGATDGIDAGGGAPTHDGPSSAEDASSADGAPADGAGGATTIDVTVPNSDGASGGAMGQDAGADSGNRNPGGSRPPTPAGKGCGCSTAPGGSSFGVVLLLALALLRRRRQGAGAASAS